MYKYNVIIDCDTGIDDSIALILAGLSKEINLLGISVCGGNTEMENAYKNTKRILHLLDLEIPLIKGLSKPLNRKLETAPETHGIDGFGEIGSYFDEKYNFNFKDESDKYDLLSFYKDTIKKYNDLIILSLGPMTNIAHILKSIPNEFKSVKRLISMGGTYKSHGNTSPVAEYNYWVDPEAANYVFLNSPVLVEMVGLDVTRKIVLNDNRLLEIKRSNKYIGDFLEKLTKFYYDFHLEYEGIYACVINDPLALLSIIDSDLIKGFKSFTQVESLGIARGQSIVDDHNFYKKAHNSIIYTDVNVEKFFEISNEILRNKK